MNEYVLSHMVATEIKQELLRKYKKVTIASLY